jgi:hypothetical protein
MSSSSSATVARALPDAPADLFVEGEYRVDQRLRTRRAAWGVDVHRDDVVDALYQGVVVEHPAGGSTYAHRYDPLRLQHLVVDLAEHRGHLLAHPAGHDHEVGLPGRSPEDLHAEAGQVEVGRPGGHHLDGAAGEAEVGRPGARGARPFDDVLQDAGEEVVREVFEAHELPGTSCEPNATRLTKLGAALATT